MWDIAAQIILPDDDTWRPEPHQVPPVAKWFIWILLGGRGAGKTEAAARDMHEHVNGPPCDPNVPGGHWPAIIAPTLGDAITSCVNGPSGLRKFDPAVKARITPGGALVRWPNGVEAKIFGAHTPDDVERLRSGGNRCRVWAEELAAWRYLDECWQHMRYGLRLGPNPQIVASTTPKNRTLIKKLAMAGRSGEVTPEMGKVVLTQATTDQNPHLQAHIKSMLYADYGGTRLGRQELNAEILEDVQGALWTLQMIEHDRLRPVLIPDHFDSIGVGVDPPGKEAGDECGIVVVGRIDSYRSHDDRDPLSDLPHGFILDDRSLRGSPGTWGHAVVEAFHDYGANLVIAEINNGWDLVKHTLRQIDPDLPVVEVTATRGKARRAEPVVAMYEQHRMHHVGTFGLLEDQMTGWDAVEPPEDWSPDRMDAMVWAASKLLTTHGRLRTHDQNNYRRSGDTRLRGRR